MAMTALATSVAYDGPDDEYITVKCIECGAEMSSWRGLLLERPLGWKYERGDHGEIVATCSGCRERDYHDGGGERDV